MVLLNDQLVQFLGEILPASVIPRPIDGESRLHFYGIGVIDHHLLISFQEQRVVLDPLGGLDVPMPHLYLLLVYLVTVTLVVLNREDFTSFSLTT